MRMVIFSKSLLPLQSPVSLPGGNRGSAPKPPLPKGGASAPPRRGDTQALPGYFFPNHSSLFPKKPSPFHMGLYFGKVPTVNPSGKNQRFLPAPFGKEAFFRPVSFYGAIPGFSMLSIDSVGKTVPKTTPQNGGRD